MSTELPVLQGVGRPAGDPLGPARTAAAVLRVPWGLRLREGVSAYLPMLLMALLALSTWWLVKNTPGAAVPQDDLPARREPDYTMSRFALERFDAGGRLKVRVEGALMRHFPDTDRIEIDGVRVRSIAPDGRVTLASARRAISNGDASEVQLLGGAHVVSTDAGGAAVDISGEFLHAFLITERVRSHLPVRVIANGGEMAAAGLDYDHGARRLDLLGPMRAVFPPRAARK